MGLLLVGETRDDDDATSAAPAQAPINDLGHGAALDEERRRRVLGSVLLAGVVFTTLVGALLTVLPRRITCVTAVAAACDVALMAAWLIRGRSMRAASGLTIGTVVIAVILTMVQTGGLRAPVLVLIPLLPVLVGSFAGARGAWWTGGLLVLGTVLVGWATQRDLIPPSLLSEQAMDSMDVAYALASIGLAIHAARATEGAHKALQAALDRQARALYEASVHDPLTHLYNRRYLSRRLDEELAFAVRHGTGLGLLFLDIDHFKRINDEHGHVGGDDVLTTLGATLRASVRREDVVARYGGEEFAILLRDLDLASSAAAAERVRRAVEAHVFLVGAVRVPVTVSIGCATLGCCEAKIASQLIAAADARLYLAKRTGRNRVVSTH